MRIAAYSITGFVIGAALGFMWSSGAKKRAPDAVKTSYKNGVATVQFDVETAALGGVLEYLGDK